MSDVPISLYTSVVKLTGENVAPPSLPPSLEETQPAINPPGTSDISGLVPYNGAIDDVNLGEKGLSTGFVQYDTTPTDTPTGAGTVVWNPDKYTLDLSMGLGGSVQQIGMETYYTPVKNQTGSLIPDGTFVMATGSLGASGRITVAPAVTDGSVDSRYMLGVTTHDIANGGDGLVTWFGEIRGFNTNTKAPIGETWVDGTVLWNNPAVAGGFTSVEPQAPNLKIPVAIVISAGNNGVIFVRPRLGMRLTDLHDVDAFTPSDKDLISYDSAFGHWNAKSLGSVIGGTSSQFLKGDGSLDSNSYALASQINISSGQVAFGTGSGVIGGDSGLTWDNALKQLNIAPTGGINRSNSLINIAGSISVRDQQTVLVQNSTLSGIDFYTEELSYLSRATNKIARIIPFSDSSVGQAFGLAFYTSGADLDSTEKFRITSGGLVGLNTSSPTNTLDVNGTARIRTIANATGDFVTASATGVIQKRTASETLADIGGIGGSGTTNYIPKFTASGTIGDSQIFDNGTNVGIGTSSPSEKLEIGLATGVGAGESRTLKINRGVAGQYITVSAEGGRATLNSVNGGGGTTVFQGDGAERMRLDSSGNVGIGTSSPTNRLHVASPNNEGIFMQGTSNGGHWFNFSSANSNLWSMGAQPGLMGWYNRTDSTYKMVITDGGNVGIRTFSPSAPLTVLANSSGVNARFLGRSDGFAFLTFRNNADSATNGQIGIGNAQNMLFYTGATERMRITSSGNVGIATTSPTNTLDVNGTARIRSLTGTVGYLPLLSSTGVMGQSVVYNTSAGSILIGTINEVSGHKVRISGGALNITNWQSSAGAYDKLSIDFGEFRGIGYDADYNEVFFAGTTTVPVKIDTDAPTDSLVINASGNVSVGGQLHSPVVAKGNSSTAVTFDWNDGNIQTVTLTANCTFTFSNPQSGASYQIIITQDATGGRTITWPVGIYWEGKTIPALTGTANSRDIVTITYDGTNYNALIARNFGT